MTIRITHIRFSIVTLLIIAMVLLSDCETKPIVLSTEVETLEYQGVKLTPLREQGNNALKGTQKIARNEYLLKVNGLVSKPLALTYDDLAGLPQESRLAIMPCVEGWEFISKWTGPVISDLLNSSGPLENARWVIFHTADVQGYTALPLEYLRERRIIMALRINDITLPAERGFPFQVVAVDKYGYKWAKWVTGIELTEKEYRGYWESRGYSNYADIGGSGFDRLAIP